MSRRPEEDPAAADRPARGEGEDPVAHLDGQGPEARVRFLGEMLDAVRQAVIATDLEGRILYCNPAVEELYGWRPEELVGRQVLEVMPAESYSAAAREIMATVLRGESWSGE
ncbi:MAG TPA: PAS domain-containing protein, partial [Longimicrobiales bacterium]|nr:PAS domain-containing protein [Longimicrobiales bacterium]